MDVWRWSGLSSLLAHNHYEETCVICESLKPKGIHLYTSFICTECENDLIHTDTNDPRYKYFLKQLKKITTPEIFS
ncbi:MAG: sigma factor G inhibitor Gin [Bacillus sp. (in: firmicutes)]